MKVPILLHLKKKYSVFSIRIRISLNYINADIIKLAFIRALARGELNLTSMFIVKNKTKKVSLAKQHNNHHHKNISGTDYLPYNYYSFFSLRGWERTQRFSPPSAPRSCLCCGSTDTL